MSSVEVSLQDTEKSDQVIEMADTNKENFALAGKKRNQK